MAETAGGEAEGARTGGSIARRMLLIAAAWSAVVLLIAGWSLAAVYGDEADRQLDDRLREPLLALATGVSFENGDIQFDASKFPGGRYEATYSGYYWAILDLRDDTRIARTLHSKSFFEDRIDTGELELPVAVRKAAAQRPGEKLFYDEPGPNERPLRIGVQALTFAGRTTPVLLFAGMDRSPVDEAVAGFNLRLGTALAVLALGVVIGMFVVIRYGLRPLHEIQDRLGDVRAGRRDNLDGAYPTELAPLVKEINTLITHNRKVVERARTHVGNLAHALKTPLAVLKNEAKGEDKLAELVRRQTDSMTSSVNHYLKRARAAAQAEVLGVRTAVAEPVEGIARMLERLYRDKGVAIEVSVDPHAVFRGERGDLDELVGNLLENAAKWCKSRVNVAVTRSEDGLEVRVDDDGPGLPAEHRAKALERGKRLDESEPGTGLGLSIVTELADIYGGRLHLEDSPIGGLRARLELPAAPL